jgi:hypothetical protein
VIDQEVDAEGMAKEKETREESGEFWHFKSDAGGSWIVDLITHSRPEDQEAQCAVFMCEQEEPGTDKSGYVVVLTPNEEDDRSGEMAAAGTQNDMAANIVRELESLMDLWQLDDGDKRQKALTKRRDREEIAKQVLELLNRTLVGSEDHD